MAIVSFAGLKNARGVDAYVLGGKGDPMNAETPTGYPQFDGMGDGKNVSNASSLKLYRGDSDDDTSIDVGARNPVWSALDNVDSEGQKNPLDLKDHVPGSVNKFKTADLLFGNLLRAPNQAGDRYLPLPGNADTRWGNWRHKGGNSAGISVSPDVYLFLETPKVGYSFSHSFKPAWEGVADKGMLKKIQGVLEVARVATGVGGGGRMMSRFAKAPAWDTTTALQYQGEVKFSFQFGRYGLFSGEHEVVRPILAIASKFAISIAGNYAIGPAPTLPMYMVKMLETLGANAGGILAGAGNDLKAAAKDGISAAGIVGALTNIEARIYNAVDKGVAAGMAGVRTFYLRVGRVITGPFICGNIAWNFDFEQVDEYGFPWKGDITLGGLETTYFPTADTFVNIFNTGSNGGSDESMFGDDVDYSRILLNAKTPEGKEAKEALDAQEKAALEAWAKGDVFEGQTVPNYIPPKK
jgi:hypothetical protein